MKNSLIIILLVALLIIGWLVYFFRDSIKGMYNNSAEWVKEDISHGAKVIQEDVSHTVKEVQIEAKK